MNYIDTAVVSIVAVVGLVIMYKALKEPLDLLFHGIANLLGWGRDKVVNAGTGGNYSTIQYG